MLSGPSLHFKEQARSQRRLGPLKGAPTLGPMRSAPRHTSWYPESAFLFFPSLVSFLFFLILALQVSQASILTAAAAKLFLISSASEKCLGMSLIYIGQV